MTGDILADQVVDRLLEGAQAIVVGPGHVEIHARRTVVVHLHAGDEGTVEGLEDQGVQDVRVGVELAHHAAEVGIDRGLDAAGDFDRLSSRCQSLPAEYSKPVTLASPPFQRRRRDRQVGRRRRDRTAIAPARPCRAARR